MTPRPIRVLIVDDDEDDFIIARDLFAEIDPAAYELEWAGSYEAALARMLAEKHDVYLIDFRLGSRNGLDLLQDAQENGINAPMILLTGQNERDVDMKAIRLGAEDFLVKGQTSPRSLERSVRYAIERKRAEREIQKLAAFPRWNPNPVLEFAADGALNYSNEAAQELARSLGRSCVEDILPANASAVVAKCLNSGQDDFTVQSSIEERTFSWWFVPIPASRTVHCYAAEITERLNLELQLRHLVKMEAIGQLAAGVAHDFNNILTIIQGHSNLLLQGAEAESEAAKPLRQICQAAERAGNLTRQLLMFSRKQVMQHRVLDLNEIIDNLTRMLQRLLGEDISLQFNGAPDITVIHADAGMIEQVLMNLAVNARDAMPKGGRLILRTRLEHLDPAVARHNPEARAGAFVSLTVTDTGCGMNDATMDRIFEPFFTTKEIGKGTGLGLATVYAIVKQHKGWIEVKSELNEGTTFKIFLPASEEAGAKSAEADAPGVEGGAETILVVEDETVLCELVSNILELYGYRVFQATSGVEALDLWKTYRDKIDLLLTDMVMPGGISGRHLAEQLLRDRPELKVIYTSGYSPGMAGKDLGLLEGFNFLPKPYPPARLAQIVRQCLDGQL